MSTLSNILASMLTVVRGGVYACPHCDSIKTRRNTSSPVSGARLCDDCGCRWRP